MWVVVGVVDGMRSKALAHNWAEIEQSVSIIYDDVNVLYPNDGGSCLCKLNNKYVRLWNCKPFILFRNFSEEKLLFQSLAFIVRLKVIEKL